jgi:hypothetical protein
MRNVHLITKEQEGADVLHQYLYITSDEEIKDVRPHKGKWQLEKGQILNKFPNYLTDLSECKLVIMTTDPDLIAEGVQAIDNEFLEWFVKNPSCERVEVRKYHQRGDVSFKDRYKIIIPQEEPKQIKCYCGHTITCDCEPLQERLEEPTEEAKQRAENYMRLKGALESKQTALELVISQLKEEIRKSAHNQLGTNRTGDYRIGLVKAINFCEQAKELEKEQIIRLFKQRLE